MPSKSTNLSAEGQESVKIQLQKFVSKKTGSYKEDYDEVVDEKSKHSILGKGGFGVVRLVRSKTNSELRAIKTIRKGDL